MTFQNSKISSAPNFEIVIEDQKVYFWDYPDFPIFDAALIPSEITSKYKIDISQIRSHFITDKMFLQNQYQLLNTEFSNTNTPEERHQLLNDRSKSDREIFDRYNELMDPSYSCPPEDKEKINEEAKQLHYFVKYVLSQPDPIQEFEQNSMIALHSAIKKQGLDFDFFSGEITQTKDIFSRETHL
jgi:hypothetical protein